MKRFLILTTHLLFCAALFAQTDDPGCNISVVVSDATCETGYTSPCSGTTGYTSSSEFIINCSGRYYIKAWTTCSAGSCSNCVACVKLYDSGDGSLMKTVTTASPCDDCCELIWENYGSGEGLILKVGLEPCPGGSQAACCNGRCTAYGSFTYVQPSCP